MEMKSGSSTRNPQEEYLGLVILVHQAEFFSEEKQ